MLLNEIDRAEIHARDTLPPEVVSLGSAVEFLDVATGATRQVRLVLPPVADIEAGRVSILTPMCQGLIRLRNAQSIAWPCSGARPRVPQHLNVTRPFAPYTAPAHTAAR